jgi:hypothetical protein
MMEQVEAHPSYIAVKEPQTHDRQKFVVREVRVLQE